MTGRPKAMVYRGPTYEVGGAAEYDQYVRQGGFDWRTHRVSISGLGAKRVRVAFDGRETWVNYDRVRPIEKASAK